MKYVKIIPFENLKKQLKTTVYYIIYTMKYFIVVLPLLVNGICLLRVNVLPENFIDNC